MATAANMGGLFAVVDLDTRKALQDVRKLQSEFSKLFKPSGPPPFNKAAQDAKRMTQELDKSAKAADKVADNVEDVGKEAVKTGASMKQIGQGFHEVSQNAGNLFTTLSLATRRGGGIGAFSNSLRTLSSLFRGGASAGAVFAASVAGITVAVVAGVIAIKTFLGAIGGLIRTSLTSAEGLETLLVSLEALLGSASRARGEFDFLTDIAKESPFFTEDIVKLDRFLLAQGLLNDELRRNTVSNLINFGSAAGLTGDKLLDLSYALGQVKNAGRLTGDEMRQLRNNFLGATLVLQSLPRYANQSAKALRDMIEAGDITSGDFFEAFDAYTKGFEGAAKKQQQTLAGLKDTIQDVFQLGLGTAAVDLADINEQFSTLGALRAPLRELLKVIEEIDFKPLGAALGAIVSTGTQPFTDFIANNGARIVHFFQVTLPNAVLFTANVLRTSFYNWIAILNVVFQVMRAFVQSMFGAAGSAYSMAQIMQFAFGVIGKIVIISLFPAISMFIQFVAAMQLVAFGALALFRVVLGVFRGIASLFGGQGFGAGFADSGTQAWETMKKGWTGAFDTVKAGANAVKDAWNSTSRDFLTLPEFPEEFGAPFAVTNGNVTDDPFSGDTTGDDAAGAASKAADKINKARNVIFDALQRLFDLPSQFEKGFFGKGDSFEATIDQIAAMGKKITEALDEIGSTDALLASDLTTRATFDLIALAVQREAALEKLKDAEKALADILAERDKFATSIRDTAIKFATALSVEDEVAKNLDSFSDRGFFYETEVTRQKSFLESLRTRSQALKDFRANLQKLSAAGLDPQLIGDLAAAGPEAAGAAVTELANGGKGVVDEVNALYSEIGVNATALGDDVAGALFDTSISAAQAVVDGLTGDLEAITEAALVITQTVYEALEPFAKEMEDIGTAAGGAAADGITAALPSIEDALDLVDTSLVNSFEDISTSTGDFTGGMTEDFATMGLDILGGFRDTFTRIKELIGPFFGYLAEKFGGLKGRLAEWWDNVRNSPFVNAIVKWWEQDVKPAWAGVWDAFSLLGQDLSWSAVKNAIQQVINFPIQLVQMPLAASATAFYNSMVSAMNYFIREYNKIRYLPDIGLMSYKGSGNYTNSGNPITFTPISSTPSTNTNTGDSWNNVPLSVSVYIGETELTDIVRTEVVSSNDRSATSLAAGIV